MPDLLLRDTDREQLISDIVAKIVDRLSPLLSPRPEFVDGNYIADTMSISRQTVDRLRADGRIPSVLIGRRRRYQPDAVIEALVQTGNRGADQ